MDTGAVTLLFDTAGYTGTTLDITNRRYAAAPDGQRFLFLKAAAAPSADGASPRLMFIGNSFEELKRLIPAN